MTLTIVTPVLNGERFIGKNIESIQCLKTPHEHIIVDGGSTDGTLDILKQYSDIKVIPQSGKNGMYGAIAQGFESASGTVITWVNCDDSVIPEQYDMMVNELILSKCDLVYSDSYIHYETSGQTIVSKASPFPKYFIRKGLLPFIQPASIYTKAFYESIGGLNTDYRITGDMDMFYRMATKKNAKFLRHKGCSVCFLKYGNSLGDRNTEKGHRERENAGIPYPSFITKALFGILRRII